MFLTAVRHEVNNLESFVVVQGLELAMNLALKSKDKIDDSVGIFECVFES